MKVDIKVPAMGESISEAIIGAFLKPNGSSVNADDEIVELETDKVNQVLYASQAGTISWSVSQGDHVKINQVIGSIDAAKVATNQKASPSAKAAEKPQTGSKQETQQKSPSNKFAEAPQTAAKQEAAQKTPEQQKESSLLQPMPSQLSPSGNARATKEQFLSELASPQSPASSLSQQTASYFSPTPPAPTERSETRKEMSKVRKAIATRLVNVLQQTAMLTTFNEVDMTQVITLRDSYKEAFNKQYNVRLGFMSFFVKAAVSALKAFPEVNAYIDGEGLVYRNYFDISIAVGTDKGLFVPVIRNCDALSFADIERSIDAYASKAREGKLVPADLQGGGFTITNGGTYGSLLSTPILNPPQSAILGMHKITKRAVVVNDQIVIRQMMYLALSYDHRVIDGKEAVSFLVHIKNALEDPARLLIGI